MSDLTQLYRHFDKDGKLLYVGVSLNTVARLCQHRIASPWFQKISRIEVENYDTREDALKAEREAIQLEGPEYNVCHQRREDEDERTDRARSEFLRQTVAYKPMYSIYEAAEALGVSSQMISQLMKSGKLGYVKPHGAASPRKFMTGWQIIEYLEHLEAEDK